MAAKAAEVAEGRHGAASDGQGARGGALSTARRHVHEERDVNVMQLTPAAVQKTAATAAAQVCTAAAQ
jgi:hypothetical protein